MLVSKKLLKKALFVIGLPTLAILSAFTLRAADKLSELNRFQLNKVPGTISIRNILVDELRPLGKIVSAYKPASYLSNEDVVYLNFYEKNASVGDSYTIYQNDGGVSAPGAVFSKVGNKIHIKGFIRITRVEGNTVVGTIYSANARIERGDLIGPPVNLEVKLSPKEPSQMVRGRILAGADSVEMIGPYTLAYINKGTDDGLTLNDKLYVVRTGDSRQELDPNLPEVKIAELVVVDVTSKFSTVYVLTSSEHFETGAHFKSAMAEVKYLD